MFGTDMYETREGFTLARPLLMPDARSFADVLEYVREWDHETMSHRSGRLPANHDRPEPRYIGADGHGAQLLRSLTNLAGLPAHDPRERNEIGPYCTVDMAQLGGPKYRGIAVRATDATIDALAPRIVTSDDHLSFKLIAHAGTARVLVIAEHSQILGSHWLAYIDPATVPVPS